MNHVLFLDMLLSIIDMVTTELFNYSYDQMIHHQTEDVYKQQL